MSAGKLLGLVVAVLLCGGAILFFSSRGYGEVSPDAYHASKALYGACLAKSSERLEAVSALLDEETEKSLKVSDTEREWLESMIDNARNGGWESAAKSARRMMEDQVEY